MLQPARGVLVGALGSVGTDLRRVTAPPAPVEASGGPDGAGGIAGVRSGEGGACDGQERGASGADRTRIVGRQQQSGVRSVRTNEHPHHTIIESSRLLYTYIVPDIHI